VFSLVFPEAVLPVIPTRQRCPATFRSAEAVVVRVVVVGVVTYAPPRAG